MRFEAIERNPERLVGRTELDPVYRDLEISNHERQREFLESITKAALATRQPFLSSHIVKALNFHAIAGLHPHAGEYRPYDVRVARAKVVIFDPPQHTQVPGHMAALLREVNSRQKDRDAITLAAWTLWRLTWIHPFVNGNGRTARAACHFIVCLKHGAWLPGAEFVPDLICQERAPYYAALEQASTSYEAGHDVELTDLRRLVVEALAQQLRGHVDPLEAQRILERLEHPPLATVTDAEEAPP